MYQDYQKYLNIVLDNRLAYTHTIFPYRSTMYEYYETINEALTIYKQLLISSSFKYYK